MTMVLNVSLNDLSSQFIDELKQKFGKATEVEVKVNGEIEKWCKINYKGTVGWVWENLSKAIKHIKYINASNNHFPKMLPKRRTFVKHNVVLHTNKKNNV